MLVVNESLQIPLREMQFTFSRSSGPGGQNVNKVNTKALLRWPVLHSPSIPADVRQRLLLAQRRRVTEEGDLLIASQRFRDQGRNVADCLEKLRAMLSEAAVVPVVRKPARKSRRAKEQRLRAKRLVTEKKQGRRRPADD